MAVTVSVNDRTVIHRGSDGHTRGFPDVCKTPKSGDPVPYTNVSLSKDAADTATSVLCDGFGVVIKSSVIAQSYGDEPGTLGGVVSGVNCGKTSFITFSMNVLIEGEPVPRTGDLSVGNHGSPPNVLNQPWMQQFQKKIDLGQHRQVLCTVLCGCSDMGPVLRMMCFRGTLSTPRLSSMPVFTPWALQPVISYDPHFPGVYIEPSFAPMGTPPRPNVVFSPLHSDHYRDAAGNPLPLPAGEWLPGTDRPDAAVAKDPKKPLDAHNLKELYEIKFPGDADTTGQEQRYKKINRDVPVHLLTVETCGCKDRRTRRRLLKRGPVEEIVPNPEQAPQPKRAPPVELPPDLAPPIPPATPVTPGRPFPKLDPDHRPDGPVPGPVIVPKLKDVLKRLPRMVPRAPVLPPVFFPPRPPPQEA